MPQDKKNEISFFDQIAQEEKEYIALSTKSYDRLFTELSDAISSLGVKVKIRNSFEPYLSLTSFKYFKSGSPSIKSVSEEASTLKSFE